MSFAVGTIVLWSGAVVDIPANWHLCDGDAGTPDLRDRFIVGAGGTYFPDDTGGASAHVHTVTTVGHSHTMPSGTHFEIGTALLDVSTTATPSGSALSKSHLPPYHALCYIMRI